jgi:hypothetical protein
MAMAESRVEESKRVLNEEQHSSTGIQTPCSRPQRVCLSHCLTSAGRLLEEAEGGFG